MGIIGGADGPTAVFVSGGNTSAILLFAAAVLAVAAVIWFSR